MRASVGPILPPAPNTSTSPSTERNVSSTPGVGRLSSSSRSLTVRMGFMRDGTKNTRQRPWIIRDEREKTGARTLLSASGMLRWGAFPDGIVFLSDALSRQVQGAAGLQPPSFNLPRSGKIQCSVGVTCAPRMPFGRVAWGRT